MKRRAARGISEIQFGGADEATTHLVLRLGGAVLAAVLAITKRRYLFFACLKHLGSGLSCGWPQRIDEFVPDRRLHACAINGAGRATVAGNT